MNRLHKFWPIALALISLTMAVFVHEKIQTVVGGGPTLSSQ
jgi:hypothetical protein